MSKKANYQELKEFQVWRNKLYNSIASRRETVMELIDSLSSNLQASSVVELSLNPLFQRNYNSLYKGIQEFLPHETDDNYDKIVNNLFATVSQTIPAPKSRHFYLFGLDATPAPRPYSNTLEDKTYIYHPNPIKGNKPISVGHSYSVLAALPERERTENVPWAVPILGDRIPSESKAIEMGNKQVKNLFKTDNSSWSKELSVLVADSVYSQRDFIGEQVKEKNLVTITRVRSNRVFYRQFIDNNTTKKAGHPRWYGDRFDLKDETTWHPPDEVLISDFITKKGRKLNLTIWGWKEMLMKGTSNYKMNRHPFTLLQITITDEKGNNVWKPMWLIVIGSRRDELSLEDCYQAYRQRYDLEHLFRFGKQKLLMTSYLTPDIKHEENWFKLTHARLCKFMDSKKFSCCFTERMGTIFEEE